MPVHVGCQNLLVYLHVPTSLITKLIKLNTMSVFKVVDFKTGLS